MSNRSFVSLLVLALALMPTLAVANPRASGQTPGAPAAPAAAPAPKPVCGLEGEINEGRGRIVARGASNGYRGELTIPLAENPTVVLKVVSDFAPHKPAVDRITLEIGAADGAASARLSGAFGDRTGRTITVVRSSPPTAQDTAWFEALMAGDTLSAAEDGATAPVSYSARQFEDDYNYLLDLLQLVAGWEVADLCLNRPAG